MNISVELYDPPPHFWIGPYINIDSGITVHPHPSPHDGGGQDACYMCTNEYLSVLTWWDSSFRYKID